jgi:2-dehydropantoate 2-reductase
VKIAVLGAGAIGGVVGARLHQAGRDIVLVARGAHFEAIRDKGLQVRSPDSDDTLRIPVVDHPGRAGIGPGDAVLLAVKSHQTAAALDALAEPNHGTSAAIVCLQNGVANERAALRRSANVYGVAVMCPTAHLEPGVVCVYSTPVEGILDIGRYPSGVDDFAETMAAAFTSGPFVSVARPDIMRSKYAKLMMNLANIVVAACPPDDNDRQTLIDRARAEGEACLRAAGIDYASREEDRQRRGDLLQARPIAGERRPAGSTWQSLARGTGDVETDYLNGEIVLLGRLHGVPTPVNELLQDLGRRLAADRSPPGTVPASDLLARL